MAKRDACPCGTGRPYEACCGPYHRGEREAPDAASLMRSRYAAFARKEVDYLWRTLHPDHEDRSAPEATIRAALASAASRCKYMGLTILESAEPDDSGCARVLFLARVFEKGKDHSFVELSEFGHDGEGWRYRSGRLVPLARLRGDPETMTIARFATS